MIAFPAGPRFLRDLVLVLGGTLVFSCLLTRYLAIPWVVAGPSMDPTLVAGDHVIVDLWTYRHRLPRQGEVVVVSGPGGIPLVKRVAADPLAPEEAPTRSVFLGKEAGARNGVGNWFVLRGDNEAVSADSREFGPVPARQFRGRVLWRYWPPGRMGRIR